MIPARSAGKTLALAGAAALTWAIGFERRWYAVRHVELPVLRQSGRLRVLFLSDLHQSRGQAHRLDFVRHVAAEHGADLLVSGGDNLEHPEAIDPVVRLHGDLVRLTGAPAVAVLGAHDYWGPKLGNPAAYLLGPSHGPMGPELDTDRLVRGFTDGGWQVLVNQREVIKTSAGPIEVVGVDDPHVGREDLGVIPQRAADDVVLSLGLTHAPYLRVLHAYDRAGFDLALAGHTHGGQLAVPGWGALVSNCDLPAAQAKGTSWIGADLRLHVSAGLGHSIYYPMRFACRPELTILDLMGPPSDA